MLIARRNTRIYSHIKGVPLTTTWQILGLLLEKTASRCGE